MQDLNDKVTGGTLTATEWNEIPSEIQNVIVGQAIALSSGDLNQLGKAISAIVANGTFYTDSGSANVYVLTKVGGREAATEYTEGFEISFIAANANTGASSVNVDGIGVAPLRDRLGNFLLADALFTTEGLDNTFRYDAANLKFLQKTSKTTDADTDLSNLTATGKNKIAKVWCNFDGTAGGPITPRDSFNVTNVTDNGTGDYTVNFTNDMANDDFAAVPNGVTSDSGPESGADSAIASDFLVGSVNITTFESASSIADLAIISLIIFGDQ